MKFCSGGRHHALHQLWFPCCVGFGAVGNIWIISGNYLYLLLVLCIVVYIKNIYSYHISYICMWMAAHKKKDDLIILTFVFVMLRPSLGMTDQTNCYSAFFFFSKLQNFFYWSWNLHDSFNGFLLFDVQSIASALGFRWPEELAMVLSVMLLLFRHSASFTPCPCEVLCSRAPS